MNQKESQIVFSPLKIVNLIKSTGINLENNN